MSGTNLLIDCKFRIKKYNLLLLCFLILIFSCLTQFTKADEQGDKIVIAVADFRTILLPNDLGEAAAEILRTEIIGSPEFKVVERSQLQKIVQELKLNISGLVADNSIQIGKISPVTHLLLGSLVKTGQVYSLSIRCVSTESGISILGHVEKFKSETHLYEVCSNIASKIKKELLTPLYTASSSSYGCGPEKAFDDQGATSWVAAEGTYEGWLQIVFPKEKRMSRVEFYCTDRLSGAGVPKRFVIEIMKNDQWEKVVEEKSNRRVEWKRNFHPIKGRKFRIKILSVISQRKPLQIAEIKFL